MKRGGDGGPSRGRESRAVLQVVRCWERFREEAEEPLGLSQAPCSFLLSQGWPWRGGRGGVGEGKVALTPRHFWA